MVYKKNDSGYMDSIRGIKRKTLVYGERTLLTEFKLTGGEKLPDHEHPYEQTGYLISGSIILRIGSERTEMNPGDSWSIPEKVIHGAEILEDAVAIEIFSPVREDYLPGN